MTRDADRDNEAPPAPWTAERSVHVLRDRWISVRADDCRTRDGVAIAPFYVLEYPDWVQVVAIDEADRVILAEQYRHGLGIISLELPTGGVEPQDADPVAAGRRELLEETGYEAETWRHVVSLAPNPALQSNRCHAVLALGARRVGMPRNDPTERTRLRHVPVQDVIRLLREGAIVQAMHVAALTMAFADLGRWPSDHRPRASGGAA